MIANSLLGMRGAVLLGVGDHLWQSTLFALVIALLAFALRKNQARMRYWLWLAASAKFLIPFSLLMILGSHLTWLRHAPSRINAGANNTFHLAMEEMSQPFAMAARSSQAAIHLSAPMIAERPSITAHVAALLRPIPLFPAIVAAVWLCGFWVVLATWTIRWWKINAALQKALPMTKGREVNVLRRMEYLGGVQQRIELKSLPISLEPGIFGLVRPVLLWPQGISERVEDAHLEAILVHEVWHVRRRDNLTAVVHMVVEAIFWFHPLVWWLETRLVAERERACDEAVLTLIKQPQIYVESILKVCEFCVESTLACAVGITGSDLKKRIFHIMADEGVRRLDGLRKLLLVATGVLAFALPLALGVAKVPQNLVLTQAAGKSIAGAVATEVNAGSTLNDELKKPDPDERFLLRPPPLKTPLADRFNSTALHKSRMQVSMCCRLLRV